MAKIDKIASIVLAFFYDKGDFVSNKKLQKLLYYIQSWHFVYFNSQNVFDDEVLPEAWVHGPVYPEVYSMFKDFGFSPIVMEDSFPDYTTLVAETGLSEDQVELIETVLMQYGAKTAFELEYLTHSEAPWIIARSGLRAFEPSSNTITKESIIKFYSSQIN